MTFCVWLTVSMCMLTESLQLCTCISALYKIIRLPLYQIKLKPQNLCEWIKTFSLYTTEQYHISDTFISDCHFHIKTGSHLYLDNKWAPLPNGSACTLLVCWTDFMLVLMAWTLLYLCVNIRFFFFFVCHQIMFPRPGRFSPAAPMLCVLVVMFV